MFTSTITREAEVTRTTGTAAEERIVEDERVVHKERRGGMWRMWRPTGG